MRGIFRPTSIIWLLVHAIVFIAGIWIASAPVLDSLAPGLSAGVGGSMAATGVAGYILFFYVLYSEQTQEQLNALWEAGLRKIFRARSVVIKDVPHPDYRG